MAEGSRSASDSLPVIVVDVCVEHGVLGFVVQEKCVVLLCCFACTMNARTFWMSMYFASIILIKTFGLNYHAVETEIHTPAGFGRANIFTSEKHA